ncbi:MAG: DUF898 domain-containing protein, partial [Methylobacteriaceae bacterium]|nr:DUF898 domain-containing protein [Methylobacteriaceae bacterium]
TSNLVLTLLSFGLARPWCVIRMARFVYGNTELAISADLDDVVDSLAVEGSAAGSEFMDIEGLAIDFGF